MLAKALFVGTFVGVFMYFWYPGQPEVYYWKVGVGMAIGTLLVELVKAWWRNRK